MQTRLVMAISIGICGCGDSTDAVNDPDAADNSDAASDATTACELVGSIPADGDVNVSVSLSPLILQFNQSVSSPQCNPDGIALTDASDAEIPSTVTRVADDDTLVTITPYKDLANDSAFSILVPPASTTVQFTTVPLP